MEHGVIPRVSVIMPVYNGALTLTAAVESILSQTFSEFELLAIDDGSSDNSLELLESFSDPRVRILRNPSNLGIAKTLNVGLASAKGEFIARMDCDDVSLPFRLERQLRTMESNEDVGLCATNACTIDQRGQVVSPPWWPKKDWTGAPLAWMLLWENPFAHSSVMLRRSILREQGLEYRPVFSEDSDLWSRLALTSRLIRLPEVLLHYRASPTSLYNSGKARVLSSAIQASVEFATALLGIDISQAPSFHRDLTVYPGASGSAYGDYSLDEMKAWIERLLHAARDRWKWDQEEYRRAVDDGQRRLFTYCAMAPTLPRLKASTELLAIDGRLSLAKWQPRAFLRILKRWVCAD